MIELRSESLRALVLPFGASLAGLWAKGHSHSLVLGAADPSVYPPNLSYFGALVGPIANRMSGAKISIDGKDWKLDSNEGTTSLHSGRNGLSTLNWDVLSTTGRSVTLSVTRDHEVDGLPGNRCFTATYQLLDGGVLRLEVTASTSVTTAVNVAHHPYWNLDGAETISTHELCVPADTYLPLDDTKLPLGTVATVANSTYDFRQPRPVPVEVPIDVNLCLGTKRHAEPVPCATLTGRNGLRLDIRSTEIGLQVYNGFGLNRVPVTLHDDREMCSCAGVALEPQGWPDAPNHKGFPSVLLQADETYRQVTEYRISG